MCVSEAVAAGVSGGRGLRLPDGERMTPGEVAAMESRLSYPARLLQRARRGDEQAEAELRGWLAQYAAEESVRRGWLRVRGEARCWGMAKVVCRELLDVGWPALSGRAAAEVMGMSAPSLCDGPWRERLEWMRRVGKSVEREVKRLIGEEIYT